MIHLAVPGFGRRPGFCVSFYGVGAAFQQELNQLDPAPAASLAQRSALEDVVSLIDLGSGVERDGGKRGALLCRCVAAIGRAPQEILRDVSSFQYPGGHLALSFVDQHLTGRLFRVKKRERHWRNDTAIALVIAAESRDHCNDARSSWALEKADLGARSVLRRPKWASGSRRAELSQSDNS